MYWQENLWDCHFEEAPSHPGVGKRSSHHICLSQLCFSALPHHHNKYAGRRGVAQCVFRGVLTTPRRTKVEGVLDLPLFILNKSGFHPTNPTRVPAPRHTGGLWLDVSTARVLPSFQLKPNELESFWNRQLHRATMTGGGEDPWSPANYLSGRENDLSLRSVGKIGVRTHTQTDTHTHVHAHKGCCATRLSWSGSRWRFMKEFYIPAVRHIIITLTFRTLASSPRKRRPLDGVPSRSLSRLLRVGSKKTKKKPEHSINISYGQLLSNTT